MIQKHLPGSSPAFTCSSAPGSHSSNNSLAFKAAPFLSDFITSSKTTAVQADTAHFPGRTLFPGSQVSETLKIIVTNLYQKEAKGNDLSVALVGALLKCSPVLLTSISSWDRWMTPDSSWARWYEKSHEASPELIHQKKTGTNSKTEKHPHNEGVSFCLVPSVYQTHKAQLQHSNRKLCDRFKKDNTAY